MIVNVITPKQLNELCRSHPPIDLIDVRTPAEYHEVHVSGARNLPLDQLDPALLIKARQAFGNEPLYLICRSGGRSERACELFIAAGFANVFNVEGGTIACVEAGVPVVRGEETASAGARPASSEALSCCSRR